MTLNKYHSRGLQKSPLVCQDFYKKNMKDKCARTLSYTLYQALLQAVTEPTPLTLSVTGYLPHSLSKICASARLSAAHRRLSC